MLPAEVDGDRFLKAMARLGWRVSRSRGSHRVLKDLRGRTLVVAFHGTLSRNSVRRALREAGIGDAEFEAEF
jgi:predicted RNA binding protein YcfA (HicA-like mRNA interferase family)